MNYGKLAGLCLHLRQQEEQAGHICRKKGEVLEREEMVLSIKIRSLTQYWEEQLPTLRSAGSRLGGYLLCK